MKLFIISLLISAFAFSNSSYRFSGESWEEAYWRNYHPAFHVLEGTGAAENRLPYDQLDLASLPDWGRRACSKESFYLWSIES